MFRFLQVDFLNRLKPNSMLTRLRLVKMLVPDGSNFSSRSARVSHFRFLNFFVSKRYEAKQKPFRFLFAPFRETNNIIFCFFSHRFASIFSRRFYFIFWHRFFLFFSHRFASFRFPFFDSNFSFLGLNKIYAGFNGVL